MYYIDKTLGPIGKYGEKIHGFYTGTPSNGFGNILCFWVLGPLGSPRLPLKGSEATSGLYGSLDFLRAPSIWAL